MQDARQLVADLFKIHQIPVPANRKDLFEKFLQDEQNRTVIDTIIQNQDALMAKWKLENRVAEILKKNQRN